LAKQKQLELAINPVMDGVYGFVREQATSEIPKSLASSRMGFDQTSS